MTIIYPREVWSHVKSSLNEETILLRERFQISRPMPTFPPDSVGSEVLDKLFFATFAREEGESPPIAAVIADGPDVNVLTTGDAPWSVCAFPSIPFTVENVRKLSSLCEPGMSYLVLTHDNGSVAIAGFADAPRSESFFGPRENAFRVTSMGPGSLLIERGGAEVARYAGGHVQARRPSPLHRPSPSLNGISSVRKRLFGWDGDIYADEIIQQLSLDAARGGHGALLLICASTEEAHQLAQDASYRLHDSLPVGTTYRDGWESSQEASQLLQQRSHIEGSSLVERSSPSNEEEEAGRSATELHRRFRQLSARCGRLAKIDGAVILTPSLDVTAFGYKVPLLPSRLELKRWHPDGTREKFPLAQRGTRHQAAAAFAAVHDDHVSLIISHDGPMGLVGRADDSLVYAEMQAPRPWATG